MNIEPTTDNFFNLYKKMNMDPISESWCGAKWFEGTIWLYQGVTASCHHNPFHKIELDENDPSSLQNTPQKIKEREAMFRGEQPKGCNYCWSVESNGGTSDRIIKTQAIPEYRLIEWHAKKKPLVEIPYMIEIAFERTCNLACAYCGPSFSSKWATDIRNNGPYIDIKTDSRYSSDNDSDIIYEKTEKNPYVEAFFKWWPDLESKIIWLRITGGEPLVSPSFWRFLDIINQRNSFKGMISINSNLINFKGELDRLITQTKNFNIKLHTSIESSFQEAEYVRDGFDREIWLKNVKTLLDTTNWTINFTTSVSNLTVYTFIDYLNLMADFKKQYGSKRIEIGCNFVHYPIFMRVQILPKQDRLELSNQIEYWRQENKNILHIAEDEHLQRFANIMKNSETMIPETYVTIENAFNDLKTFVQQYDYRRKKDFRKSLHPKFIEWYEKL